MSEIACFGCGALVPDTTGPIHGYMDASPGCWQLYCELQDWKNSLVGGCGVTTAQFLADSYAAQHSTNPDRRNRQSVAVHLMSLCASLECGISSTRLRTMIGNWTHHDYAILQPRPDHYPLTVRTVVDEASDNRTDTVAEMARTTWASWSMHHGAIRAFLARSLA